MSESEDIAFFCAELCRYARSLPMTDAARMLRGALALIDERAGIESVRAAYQLLRAADDQLELIASGQLKLNLRGNGQ